MTGVRTGSRLEQLEALRARLDHEIAIERRNYALTHAPTPAPGPTRRKSPDPSRGDQILTDLGITANQVKVWALSHGLVDKIARGRCSTTLIEQYVEAHR